MQKVRAMKPDLLLASGDLSEDGSRVSYQRLQGIFAPLDIPVLALPGNHDDPGLLAMTFPGSPTDSMEVTEHGPWQIIRLNSCLPGKPEGLLDESTLMDLEEHLRDRGQRPCMLALHHQPINIGGPWIDKYPLLQPQAILKIIDDHTSIKAVTWGHVHQAFELYRNGTVMLGGPSSSINSLPGSQKFTPDPAGPSCRWIELGVNGALQTGIVYV